MRFLLLLLILLMPAAFAQGDIKQRCTICAVTEGAGPEPVAATLQHQEQTHYFCSEGCKAKFESDPQGWADKFGQLKAVEGPVKLGPLPDFELELPDGKMLKKSDWKGKVLIVDFWATWCGPCVQEIPEFVEFQKQNPNDLRILGFSYDKEAEQHDRLPDTRQTNVLVPRRPTNSCRTSP
jgi:thiol-disulfide isomerase/thioredoxin